MPNARKITDLLLKFQTPKANQNNENSEASPTPNICPKILKNSLELIGSTPVIRLSGSIPAGDGSKFAGELLAKCEYLNPTGSVQARVVLNMLEILEKNRALRKGFTLISVDRDAFGLALAHISAIKGYKCITILPPNIFPERIRTFHACGAYIIRSGPEVNSGQVIANQILKDNPESFLMEPEIFDSDILYGSLALEIGALGKLDMIVVGESIKSAIPALREVIPKKCKLIGVGRNEDDLADAWIQVKPEEGDFLARKLIRIEGILVGPQSGSIYEGGLNALKQFEQLDNVNFRCLLILDDALGSGDETYLDDSSFIQRGHIPYTEMDMHIWWWDIPLSNVLLQPLLLVSEDSLVNDGVLQMIRGKISALVVVDKNGIILGISTLSHLLGLLEKDPPTLTEESKFCKESEAILLNFEKVQLSDKLWKVMESFRRYQFALVVQTTILCPNEAEEEPQAIKEEEEPVKAIEKERIVGLVAQLDLLRYKREAEEVHRIKHGLILKDKI